MIKEINFALKVAFALGGGMVISNSFAMEEEAMSSPGIVIIITEEDTPPFSSLLSPLSPSLNERKEENIRYLQIPSLKDKEERTPTIRRKCNLQVQEKDFLL